MANAQIMTAHKRGSRWWRFLRRALIVLGVLLLVLVIEELAFLVSEPNVQSSGRNAIWLQNTWSREPHTDAQYLDLVRSLRHMGITDVYVNLPPLRSDGNVEPGSYGNARKLIGRLKASMPRLRVQAWIHQVTAAGDGPLDLTSGEVRRNVVKAAGKCLDLGFNGIHYDMEPVYSGDRSYIALLEATRKLAHSRHAVLSVAAYQPEPVPFVARTARLIAKNPGYWTQKYYLEVASKVDQVAVMTYDSGIPLPGLYGRVIGWTARWSLHNGIDDLLIGIPTYGSAGPAHVTWVETPGNALKGLKRGVASLDPQDRAKVGAAVFAEWTTSAQEEQLINNKWIKH